MVFLCCDETQEPLINCQMIYIQAKDWKDYLNRYRVRIVIQSGLENHYLKEIYDDCC